MNELVSNLETVPMLSSLTYRSNTHNLNSFEIKASSLDLRVYHKLDQLPVGMIAQLVEHCTSITGAMGSISIQA